MIPLAQIDPTPIAEGLAKNPLAWISALGLLSSAWLLRTLLTEKEKAALAVDVANRAMVESMKEDQKEQKQIMGEIIPLASKLVDAIETVERVTDKLTTRGP